MKKLSPCPNSICYVSSTSTTFCVLPCPSYLHLRFHISQFIWSIHYNSLCNRWCIRNHRQASVATLRFLYLLTYELRDKLCHRFREWKDIGNEATQDDILSYSFPRRLVAFGSPWKRSHFSCFFSSITIDRSWRSPFLNHLHVVIRIQQSFHLVSAHIHISVILPTTSIYITTDFVISIETSSLPTWIFLFRQ